LTAKMLLETLMEVNTTLTRLRADQKLTPEEQNLRRVVMLARRIHLESDPAKLAQFRESKPLPPRTVAGARTTTPATAKDKAMTKPTPKPESKKESAPSTGDKDKKKASAPPTSDKDKKNDK
jgi:hypothetical protein